MSCKGVHRIVCEPFVSWLLVFTHSVMCVCGVIYHLMGTDVLFVTCKHACDVKPILYVGNPLHIHARLLEALFDPFLCKFAKLLILCNTLKNIWTTVLLRQHTLIYCTHTSMSLALIINWELVSVLGPGCQ